MGLRQVYHIIEGEEVSSLSGRTFQSTNPATGLSWAEVAFGEVEDVDHAVESGWNAFNTGVWSRLPAAERGKRMRAVASLIVDQADQLAELETKDNGKPLSAAKGDILGAASLFECFISNPGTCFWDSVHR